MTGSVRGNCNNAPCWSSGGTGGNNGGAGRVYGADGRKFLPLDANGHRVANGSFTVELADSGKSGNGNITYSDGASLVVVYKIVVPGFPLFAPLKAVVIYDGAFTLNKFTSAMNQNIGGIYQAYKNPADPATNAKMTQIVANGQSSNTETLMINGTSVSNPFTGGAP